jgi:hypothetical protein
MVLSFARPPVDQLLYRLYDRAIHPELFPSLASRSVRHSEFQLQVWITPFGHTVEWRNGSTIVTELIVPSDWPIPDRGRMIGHKLRGEQRGQVVVGTTRIHAQTQVEHLAPERFVPLHDELAHDGARRGLVFHFRPQHRLGLTPLGWITAEVVPGGLALTAFHTFPEEFVILKTQTLLERIV